MRRFFLGIRLPKLFEEQCEVWRRRFRAPKTVAHITVIPPFRWQSHPDNLLQILKQSLSHIQPFNIQGKGLGAFATRVLFVNVELNANLKTMHQHLSSSLKETGITLDTRPYHPHITLATRLNPTEFSDYKKQLQDFTPCYNFTCEGISVFQFTDFGKWEELAIVPLGTNLSSV